MTPASTVDMLFGERFSCFGEFDPQDRICKSHCALRIRCAVEKGLFTRMDMADEDMMPELMSATTQ